MTPTTEDEHGRRVLGRYTIHGEIAAGGMATVHLGHATGAAGFVRTVAIKEMHPHLAKDPEFVSMFIDEARVAARIHHPNVVSTLDVVANAGHLFVVMEYVHGAALASLMKVLRAHHGRVPIRVALRIAYEMLSGLHAAHEAVDEKGGPLGVVHRDVSPQNVLVGAEGVSRIIDFGIAKAAGRLQSTTEGGVKGKIAYMAPEQLLAETVDRRSDVYATFVVLWEMLTGSRLFQGESQGATMQAILGTKVAAPSTRASDVSPELDAVVARGLARRANDRFATAHEAAAALETVGPHAASHEVAQWLKSLAGADLQSRGRHIADLEEAAQKPPPSAGDGLLTETSTAPVDPDERLIPAAPTATDVSAASEGPAPTTPRREPRRRWVAFVVSGAFIVVALAGLAGIVALGRRPAVPLPTVTEPIASPAASNATAAASASAAPSSTTAPSQAAAVATAGAVPSSSGREPAAPSGGGSGLKRHSRAPHLAASCDPPYIVDALGVRTYKRECVTGRP